MQREGDMQREGHRWRRDVEREGDIQREGDTRRRDIHGERRRGEKHHSKYRTTDRLIGSDIAVECTPQICSMHARKAATSGSWSKC